MGEAPARARRPRRPHPVALARRGWARAARTWRRSLHLRVVAATVGLALAATVGVGLLLAHQISDRLYASRRDQVLGEAHLGAEDAQTRLDQFDVATPTDVRDRAQTLLGQLEGVGPDRDRAVMLLKPPGNRDPSAFGDLDSSDAVTPVDVPQALRAAVRSSRHQQYQPIAVVDADGRRQPWLVVGEQVQVPIAGRYELYFLFDLSREQATLVAVQRVLAGGSAVLVLLVAAVAAVVVRQVVEPVRQAAEVAGRLASGDLGQRMVRSGDDDLARLASSFNAMATSLQQQISRLEALGALQQRFVSDVSHELRTPMTTIRMASDVLHASRASFDPAPARSAELLTAQLDRFEGLLADLLEMSRLDAGAADLDAESHDLRDLVDRVVEAEAHLAAVRATAVRIVRPPRPATAEVDRRRVERIVRNLLVNALEHGEGRPVSISVGVDAAAVAVRVADAGVGLSDEQAARVFDRFWRADPARARTTGGTGLGLAISLEDARLHGGRLEAAGRRRGGASFLLTLPRTPGGPLTGSPLALEPDPPAPTGPAGLALPPATARRALPRA